jgi:hypothetical protein
MTTPWIQPDAIDASSDWASMSWTGWPIYGSREFAQLLEQQGQTLGDFKKTNRYTNAVAFGLIEDDQWTGRRFPLERWGWVKGEPLGRQLRLRADKVFREVRDELTKAQTVAARMLYAQEIADTIRNIAGRRALRTGCGGDLTVSDVPPPANGRRCPDQADAWNRALPDASGPLVGALMSLDVPPICTAPTPRAVYDPSPGRIVVASLTDTVGLRRAAAHWLGSVGWNGHAALSMRAARIVDGPLVPLPDGGAALPGSWVDADDARIFGSSSESIGRSLVEGRRFTDDELVKLHGAPTEDDPAEPQNVLAGIAGRFAPGRDLDLALTWEVWPEQVILWLLTMWAAFVEVPTEEPRRRA